jgi:hypothetical protein
VRTTDRWVSLAMQAFDLRNLLPSARSRIRHRARTLTSVFELRPTPDTCWFTVKVYYRLGWRPEVHVLHPTLQVRYGADQIPHSFSDSQLCLHLDGEWQPTMSLADTIVPWTSEWLLYYELWLATGTWQGGGHGEPQPDDQSAALRT